MKPQYIFLLVLCLSGFCIAGSMDYADAKAMNEDYCVDVNAGVIPAWNDSIDCGGE